MWITEQTWNAACRNLRGNITKNQRDRALECINDLHNKRHAYIRSNYVLGKIFGPALYVGHYFATADRLIRIHTGANLEKFTTSELTILRPKKLTLTAFNQNTA